MATVGSLAKASFEILEGSKGTFTVQFNPKEFSAAKGVDWQPSKDKGKGNQPLEFQQGKPMDVDMTLMFDTTMDNQDVRAVWVNKLVALMNAEYPASSKELGKLRPPKLLFTWGTFKVTCVVTSVTTKYKFFSTDGTPLRAECQVKLKEWTPTSVQGSGTGTTLDFNKVSLVEGAAGDTVSSVASNAGLDWRDVASANNIDDPMQDLAGMDLVLPSY